jgi:hypothetical protein
VPQHEQLERRLGQLLPLTIGRSSAKPSPISAAELAASITTLAVSCYGSQPAHPSRGDLEHLLSQCSNH